MPMGPTMKVLLILLIACFAALEFFHQLSDDNALNAIICLDPQAKPRDTGELLRQHHLHGHR
jgi:hypothetical protein